MSNPTNNSKTGAANRAAYALAALVVLLLLCAGGGWWALRAIVSSPPSLEENALGRAWSNTQGEGEANREPDNAANDTREPRPVPQPTYEGTKPKDGAKPPDKEGGTGQPETPRKPRVLPAEPAAVSVLDAKGRGKATVARAAQPHEKRWVGFAPNRDASWDEKKRRVRGMVCELRGGDYVPLSEVIVTDYAKIHRTFTDKNGRFEFEAYYSDEKNSRGESPIKVFLLAIHPGYTDKTKGIGWWYNPEDLDPEHGYIVVLTRIENVSVTVQVTNPGLIQESLTIWMACEPHYTYVLGDEWLYLSVEADEMGKAVFSIPPDTFTSVGAFGKGCMMWPTSLVEKAKTKTEIIYHIELKFCDSFRAGGVVKDLRTGKPLAAARVGGMSYAEVSYTDEAGRFSLWLSRKPVSVAGEDEKPTLLVNCLGYMSVTRRLNDSQAFPPELGVAAQAPGGEEAPWEIGLRPWVKAKGLVVASGMVFPEDAAVMFAIDDSDMEDEYNRFEVPVAADGAFNFARMPWGVAQLKLVVPGMKPSRRKLKVDAAWQGSEPYTLTATAAE